MTTMPMPHRARPLRRIDLLGACACLAGLLVAAAAHAQAPDAPTFEIRRYVVEGNTVLTTAKVEAVLAAYTGPGRSFDSVQAAVAALQQAYLQAGFGAVKVAVPEQRLADGTIRLEVVEARLRSVTVIGATRFDGVNIRRSLPALRDDATPNTSDLARNIRLANENPAKRISVDLRSDAPGSVEAVIAVQDDKPWKVGAVIDNTGTPQTGRLRSGVFFQHANVADRDQVFTGQYITSPDHADSVAIVAANYRVPLYGLGDSVDVYGVHADVDSGVVGNLFTVRGRGSVAGIRYTQPLPPTAAYRHRLSYGFEYRVYDNRVRSLGVGSDVLPDVTLRPVSLGYTGALNGASRQLDFNATWIRNVPGGPSGGAADIAAARAGAAADYSVLRWSANAVQGLPEGWQLRLAGDGQTTRDALVSGEQFGLGGQDSVRGFLEREVTGDTGYRATLEAITPDFGSRMIDGLGANALVFYDLGRVARNRALPGEAGDTSIASFGAGVRLAFAPHATLRIDIAHIVRGTADRPRGSSGLHFSLGVAY